MSVASSSVALVISSMPVVSSDVEKYILLSFVMVNVCVPARLPDDAKIKIIGAFAKYLQRKPRYIKQKWVYSSSSSSQMEPRFRRESTWPPEYVPVNSGLPAKIHAVCIFTTFKVGIIYVFFISFSFYEFIVDNYVNL